MSDDQYQRIERIVSTHDLSWLLDLDRKDQLELNPPYQRRSVWTPKDRRYFIDTIFRNYPSPAIFLHKTINDDTGEPRYHVVDGKQRISTVLLFLKNKVTLPKDFGDSNFDGKRWSDFADNAEVKRRLWNYRITVEEIDDLRTPLIKDVFERLNKNSSKLTAQELRHARFDGWMLTFLEEEVTKIPWAQFKIHTAAKEKRMMDVQNLAELATVVVRGGVSGFDQLDLDQFFADHDDIDNLETDFDPITFKDRFNEIKNFMKELDDISGCVSKEAQPFLHFYSLWSYLSMSDLSKIDKDSLSHRYQEFMIEVRDFDVDSTNEEIPEKNSVSNRQYNVARYKAASVGATTDAPKREERLVSLSEILNSTDAE